MIIVLITVYVTGFRLNVFLTFCSTSGVMIMQIENNFHFQQDGVPPHCAAAAR
jgi:hypothetical protein